MRTIPEADWKVFREVRVKALERFCQRILQEVGRVSADSAASFHDRYLRVYRLLQQRDREIGDAFNDPRRSRAMMQLATMKSLRLLEPDDLARLTAPTRETIAIILGEASHL